MTWWERVTGWTGKGRAEIAQPPAETEPARRAWSNLIEAFKRDGFGARTGESVVQQVEWLYIGVRAKADAIMFTEAHISRKGRDGQMVRVEDENDPMVKLFAMPNPEQTWAEFAEQMIFILEPWGRVGIAFDPAAVNGVPMGLKLLWPQKMRAVKASGNSGPVIAWEYRDEGMVKRYPAAQVEVIQMPRLSAYADAGVGAVKANERLWAFDDAAAQYAWDFFRRGARPASVIEFPDTKDQEALDQIMTAWHETHRVDKSPHATGVLMGGAKLNRESETPKESDFNATRKANREAILAFLRVPPLIAGIIENANRSNSVEQTRTWYNQAIIPMLNRLKPHLSRIAKTYNPAYEWDYIAPMTEDSDVDPQIAAGYFQVGALTPNEIRTIYAGLPAVKGVPAMDWHYVNPLLVPLEAPEIPDPEAKPEPKPEDKPKEEPAQKTTRRTPTPLQQKMLRVFVTQRTRFAIPMSRDVARFFIEQGRQIAERYLDGQRSVSSAFEFGEDDRRLARLMRGQHSRVMSEGFRVTAEIFDIEDADFEPGKAAFNVRLDRLARLVVGRVSETTKDELARIVSEGTALGLSPREIARGTTDGSFAGITGTFEQFAPHRAQLIARTETARALDQANVRAYEDLGVTVCDVIGCEDNEIVPGQKYGCNSENIPVRDADRIEFHPNHRGAIVPRITVGRHVTIGMARAIAVGVDTTRALVDHGDAGVPPTSHQGEA